MFKPIAIVTGADGDIGRAILARLGKDFITLGSDIKGEGVEHVDVTQPEELTDWLRKTGSPSVCIVNAAIVIPSPTTKLTSEDWNAQIRVNLDGAFNTAQAAALAMQAGNIPGHILFIGSWAAHAPDQGIPAYCASKAAVRMLMKCLAIELAPHRIQVNELALGYVDAGLSKQMFEADSELRANCINRVPNRQLITAQEVAEEVARIVSSGNPHLTGSVILMDGGLSLTGGGNV